MLIVKVQNLKKLGVLTSIPNFVALLFVTLKSWAVIIPILQKRVTEERK